MLKEIQEQLETKFDKSQIKKRIGSFGKELLYLETHTVIRRLNSIFDSNWSFKILKSDLIDGHMVILGELTVPNYELVDDKKVITGWITKQSFGGKKAIKVKATGEWLDLAADEKSASSDSLKKCGSLLGIGLDLYETVEEEVVEDDKQDTVNELEVSAPITPMQVSAIKSLAAKAKVADVTVFISELLKVSVTSLESLNQKQGAQIIVALNSKANG